MLNKLKKIHQSENLESYPNWVLDGPPVTKKLYDATNKIYHELLIKIQSKDIKGLDLYNGPIVKSHIAETANVSPSNIRVDRQEKLFTYLNDKNTELLKIIKKVEQPKKKKKRKNKADLEKENHILKAKLKQLEQDKYCNFFKQLIANQTLQKQKDLALQNEKLLIDQANDEEVIKNLRTQVSLLFQQLNKRSDADN